MTGPSPVSKRGGWPRGKPRAGTGVGMKEGHKRAPREVIELAKVHTEEAIEKLAYWMRKGDGRTSVTAAAVLLDRGWGKARQAIDAKVTLTDERVLIRNRVGRLFSDEPTVTIESVTVDAPDDAGGGADVVH